MVTSKTIWICGACQAEYYNEDTAIACEAKGFHPLFKVGNIVTARAGFNWFDGDHDWITNPWVLRDRKGHPERARFEELRYCFDDCCSFSFYYVVTMVDMRASGMHRPRYHLFTGAMKPDSGYHGGYTFDEGHFPPQLVLNPPPQIIETSRALMGNRAEDLL